MYDLMIDQDRSVMLIIELKMRISKEKVKTFVKFCSRLKQSKLRSCSDREASWDKIKTVLHHHHYTDLEIVSFEKRN